MVWFYFETINRRVDSESIFYKVGFRLNFFSSFLYEIIIIFILLRRYREGKKFVRGYVVA